MGFRITLSSRAPWSFRKGPLNLGATEDQKKRTFVTTGVVYRDPDSGSRARHRKNISNS